MYRTRELYDERNTVKQSVHFSNFRKDTDFFVNQWEIRYIKMWLNMWYEENWKKNFERPVVVLKKIWNLFLCAALTTKGKTEWYQKRYYIDISSEDEKSFIILSQMKTIDKCRFVNKIWEISSEKFKEIKKIFREFYFPKD
jgi:hypothetical protein